ncbi:MAG: quinone-dependent dihydroorotate dehydrogenase [Ferruginibacter sp.]|nr:quinone-dependent dihydroorotate dehydrogenase [Ferruginibacter sp.]
MYKTIRTILFMFDAEKVHHFSMETLRLLCAIPFIKKIITKTFQPTSNSCQPTVLFNLTFKNPIGLAAGFDKNAKYLNELQALGFGFVEIGTVTPLPQDGNEKPRLFRLPKDKALINRMGFNNDGVDTVAKRLKNWQLAKRQLLAKSSSQVDSPLPTAHFPMLIGGNIGKNKATANENAWKDYEICFNALHNYVDYFVVNVSSPNTPGLRELQEKEPLKKILTHLQQLNKNFEIQKPILLKIAPDLTQTQIHDVLDLAQEINLDGLVAANTTIDRNGLFTTKKTLEKIGAGGLSGLPLKSRATEIVKYINQNTNGKIPIIASGGIFTGADAAEKLLAGASLVQVWTGFVYEGPCIVKKIILYLANRY